MGNWTFVLRNRSRRNGRVERRGGVSCFLGARPPTCRRSDGKAPLPGRTLSFLAVALLWFWGWGFWGGIASQIAGGAEATSSQVAGSPPAVQAPALPPYSLYLDPGWEKAAKEKPLVISLPGMGSTGTPIEKILRLARKEGFPCGRFVFPHEPIQQTACRLAHALQDIGRKAPERRVALVSYSLGGLIGRAVIEDPELDPGNVRALIMLCPPNHGSQLLQLLPWKDGEKNFDLSHPHPQTKPPAQPVPSQVTLGNASSGLAAVWADLRPGSAFLTRLNSRPRNPKVRYTILLGDRAYLGPEDRKTLTQWTAQLPPVGPLGHGPEKEPLGQVLGQLDELVHGRGDGAVSIRRGQLEGVQDVHIFHFSHLGVLRSEWESPEGRRAQELILDRLRTCPQ